MFSFLPGLGRPTTAWFNAGPSTSFPNIDPETDSADLSQPRTLSTTSSQPEEEEEATPSDSSKLAQNQPGDSSNSSSTSPCSPLNSAEALAAPPPCNLPNPRNLGCRVFFISREDGARGKEVKVQSGALEFDDEEEGKEGGKGKGNMEDEVLVFRFRGLMHATDHKCPHALFPLSKALPFDIEDFGVVLSAGLQCPKHGWSFDMFTGMSDRAAYRLNVWEVKEEGGQVWVRRKVRMG